MKNHTAFYWRTVKIDPAALSLSVVFIKDPDQMKEIKKKSLSTGQLLMVSEIALHFRCLGKVFLRARIWTQKVNKQLMNLSVWSCIGFLMQD